MNDPKDGLQDKIRKGCLKRKNQKEATRASHIKTVQRITNFCNRNKNISSFPLSNDDSQ